MAITLPPHPIDQIDREISNEYTNAITSHQNNGFLNKLKLPFRIALILAAGLVGLPSVSVQAQQNPDRVEGEVLSKKELKFAKLVHGFSAALEANKFREASIFFDKMLSFKDVELTHPSFYAGGIMSYQKTNRRNKQKIEPTCDRAIRVSNNQDEFRDSFLGLLNICAEAVLDVNDHPRYATAALQYILFKHHLLTGSVDMQTLLRNIASDPDDATRTLAIFGYNPEAADVILTFYLQVNPKLIDYRDPDAPKDINRPLFIMAKALAEGGISMAFAWRYINEKKVDLRWQEEWQKVLRMIAPLFTKFEIQSQNRSTQ